MQQPKPAGAQGRGKIQMLLDRHRDRYAHNKVPFEKATYLQMVHNPLVREQFISVQQVIRLKSLDLGYALGQNGEGSKAAAEKRAMGFGLEALLGNQVADINRVVTNDRGKSKYQYQYETCKTSGPKRNEQFTDPENKLEGVGDGTFERVSIEEP